MSHLCLHITQSIMMTPRISPHLTHSDQNKMADILQRAFSDAFSSLKICILIQIPLNFVPNSPINNITSSIQTMAWRQTGDIIWIHDGLVYWHIYIYITEHRWVKSHSVKDFLWDLISHLKNGLWWAKTHLKLFMSKNFEGNMSKFVVTAVMTDGLPLRGPWPSAGTIMTNIIVLCKVQDLYLTCQPYRSRNDKKNLHFRSQIW